jgi:hypothetical protein
MFSSLVAHGRGHDIKSIFKNIKIVIASLVFLLLSILDFHSSNWNHFFAPLQVVGK